MLRGLQKGQGKDRIGVEVRALEEGSRVKGGVRWWELVKRSVMGSREEQETWGFNDVSLLNSNEGRL
jgi:hypothetical protein